MRFAWLFLAIVIIFSSVVSASIEVGNYTFKNFYSPGEAISGEINLTIVGENYDLELRSSEGEKMSLGNFLVANGVDYSCSPADCSIDYSFSSPSIDKNFSIDSEKVYGGFVLEGSNVELTGMSFDVQSNFDVSALTPLTINYFNGKPWEFNKFSDVFSPKSWGCYDVDVPIQGPLVGTSSYCEMISFSETGSVIVGAYVDSGDNKILDMNIYPGDGGTSLGSCSYNPVSEEGCRIDAGAGEIFSAGDYQVCVSSPVLTNYRIYQESSGAVCGFVKANGPESSVKDYAIFRQTAMYADAGLFSSDDIDFSKAVSSADDVLLNRYERNCSKGCVLPMFFFGIPQYLRFYNLNLEYTRDGESDVDHKIYDLTAVPATISFSGVLDLSLSGFNVSKSGNYSLYLGEKKLFESKVEKILTPTLKSLSPLNPPAGVPVKFFVGVDYNTPNASLTYKWKFGNGSLVTTENNSIVYTLKDISNYSVSVEVSAGGNLTSKKSFLISSINPAEAVNSTLNEKKKVFNEVVKKINTFPVWYQDALSKIIDMNFYSEELSRMEKAREIAVDAGDFIEIAKDLYALDSPTGIFFDEEEAPFLMTSIADVKPQTILDIAGGSSEGSLDDYRAPILNWQVNNVQAVYSTKVYSVVKWQGDIIPIFRTYDFDVTLSEDDEGYFVINCPFAEIYFNELAGARKVEDSTVIIFDRSESKSFEFYLEDPQEVTFFISPKLSSIVLEANIDTSCNSNLVCEKELGENSRSCRIDCKPVFGAIVYVIIAILFVLGIYTFLQIWYKKRYEVYLFRDANQLYNLLMYVTNARARGQTDGVIAAALRQKGWSGERINYVIRKSRGQRTGLPEIIPIERIAAYRRNRMARRKIATVPQQQFGRNINKSGFQRGL